MTKHTENKIDKEVKKESDTKENPKERELQKEKIEDLTDTLQRLQADFENYKKQIEKRCLDTNKRIKADTF